MKYKTILALSLTAMLTVGVMITGCGNKTDNSTNTTDNGNTSTDKLKESADKAGDAVKDGAEAVKDSVEGVGNAIKYTAIDVKNDISKAGRDLKESVDSKKDYFAGTTETDYTSENGELIRVYEFKNSADADAAVKKISSDGLTIDGNAVYTTKPHYYRKGDTIVIYEGTNDAYITEFNTLYGNPLI
ncbi:lipoprotein [Clostridium butyricum]|uniref:lipoprotein n=1 Tax=Clostridium butyricum TaxID=1492 RepID=UPI0018A8D614|nr:lipoprotein [Clostridium butyricum]MDB2138175.1 lipoprotein [Clostridium butyricum]